MPASPSPGEWLQQAMEAKKETQTEGLQRQDSSCSTHLSPSLGREGRQETAESLQSAPTVSEDGMSSATTWEQSRLRWQPCFLRQEVPQERLLSIASRPEGLQSRALYEEEREEERRLQRKLAAGAADAATAEARLENSSLALAQLQAEEALLHSKCAAVSKAEKNEEALWRQMIALAQEEDTADNKGMALGDELQQMQNAMLPLNDEILDADHERDRLLKEQEATRAALKTSFQTSLDLDVETAELQKECEQLKSSLRLLQHNPLSLEGLDDEPSERVHQHDSEAKPMPPVRRWKRPKAPLFKA